MTHRLVEGQARARALFAQDPGLAAQLFQGCAAAFGQRVAGRAEHHQLILDPGLHFDVRVLAIAFDQAQVQLVVSHLLHHVGGVLHVQLEAALRVALHEVADQQGGQVVADGEGGAQLQQAVACLAAEQALDLAGLVEQRHGLRQQLAAEGVERQALAGAVEQLAVGLPLQLTERGAGGGLREGQRFRRTRHAFLLGHGDEDFQLSECESHIYITNNPYLDNSLNRYCGPH